MSVYAGKCLHFPEISNMADMIRFESEALGATDRILMAFKSNVISI